MLRYGYAGRILRVDLNTGKYRIEDLDPAWIHPVIGEMEPLA